MNSFNAHIMQQKGMTRSETVFKQYCGTPQEYIVLDFETDMHSHILQNYQLSTVEGFHRTPHTDQVEGVDVDDDDDVHAIEEEDGSPLWKRLNSCSSLGTF